MHIFHSPYLFLCVVDRQPSNAYKTIIFGEIHLLFFTKNHKCTHSCMTHSVFLCRIQLQERKKIVSMVLLSKASFSYFYYTEPKYINLYLSFTTTPPNSQTLSTHNWVLVEVCLSFFSCIKQKKFVFLSIPIKKSGWQDSPK